MTDKICHLCGTHYNDDPYFKEQPAHTPENCLDILWYRSHEAERKVNEINRQLAHAEKEYKARKS